MAGGEWPKRAREAALTAHDAAGGDDASRLEVLVADIRDAFAAKGTPARDMFGAEKVELPSQTMVKFLISREGHPWAEMGKSGKPLTQNRLARMLKDLGIKPVKVGPEDKRVQGYVLAEFEDAFARYLSEGAFKPDIRTEAREMGTSDIFEPDSPDPGCPVEKCEKPQ